MQTMTKTNRNSSQFLQWDLDEQSFEQHVYPSVSDLDHVPSEKKKILTEQGFWIYNYPELYNWVIWWLQG